MDGILIINKPKGYTSHDVVAVVKKIYKEKVGHTGTLDPNATGVLPLLIGQGTKLSYYLINHDKEYVVTLQLGMKTDTADGEGKVLEEQRINEEFIQEKLKKENVEQVLHDFLGEQEQVPPMYSAIKVDGKKLYEYARQGKKVTIEPRRIKIYEIQLMHIKEEEKQIVFRVKCSKGTYIRSLCEDIADKMGTIGFMKELQRTIVGNFHIEDTIELEMLKENKDNIQFLKEKIISIEEFFKENNENDFICGAEEIQLNQKRLELFLNGVKLSYHLKNGLYRVYNEENRFIGIGIIKNNFLKREIIVEKEK